jgi:MoaA/NifB/PqqE/SkfB family radical SAM enzyme
MKSPAVDTKNARRIISKVAEFGFRDFVFAGGDPFIRKDIGELVLLADSLGLKVEVQTNCELIPKNIDDWIHKISLLGISIDGASADIHDDFRDKKGNFEKVISFLHKADQSGIPTVVRSVVAKPNYDSIPDVGSLLTGIRHLRKWSLLEFSAAGDGYLHQDFYGLEKSEFFRVTEDAERKWGNVFNIDIYHGDNKKNVYFLIQSNGDVYTTAGTDDAGKYRPVGNILEDDVGILVERLQIDFKKHRDRYAGLIPNS